MSDKPIIKKAMSIMDFFKRKEQQSTVTITTKNEKTEKCPVCNAVIYIESQSMQVHVNTCLDAQSMNSENDIVSEKESTTTLTTTTTAAIMKDDALKINEVTATTSTTTTTTTTTTAAAITHPLFGNNADSAAISENSPRKRKLPLPPAASSSSTTKGKKSGPTKKTKPCPFYKWMRDTPFVVDAFNYGKIENCEGYFLSHFHSDHYGGLTGSGWRHGPIYCSKVTANLVRQQLKVDSYWLHPLPLDELVDINDSVKVALIDANHCPGSVLFLFVCKKKGTGQWVRHLHTGDFRASPKMCLHPLIRQPENPTISCLYLDTTYMNPMYAFPAQEECIQAVCDVIKKEMTDTNSSSPVSGSTSSHSSSSLDTWIKKVMGPKKIKEEEEKHNDQKKGNKSTLILVGTYTIGKEKVFFNAAKTLDSKIYVNNRKKLILQCQENKELTDRLTDQPSEAQVHVVPLHDIRYDKLAIYLDQYKSHFTNLIAIRPTGWAYKPTTSQITEMKQAPLEHIVTPPADRTLNLLPTSGNNKSRIKIYSVPYSEHSSFRELASFIASLDIDTIIPTVNLSKSAEMNRYFDSWKFEKMAKRIEVVPFMTEEHW